MAHILQCGFLAPSHLHLFRRIDASLTAHGHGVTNVLTTSQAAAPHDLGLTDIRFNPSPPGDSHDEAAQSVAALRDPERRAAGLRAWLLDGLAQRVDFVRRVIDERQPSMVLCDPMSIEGVVAAACSKLPWIGVSSNFAHLTPPAAEDPYEAALRIFEPIANEAMRRFGVTGRFRGGELLSPTRTIMPGAREWSVAPEPGQTMCGYLPDVHAPAGVPRRVPHRPLIIVSFGSILHLEPAFIASFARAAEGEDLEFLVSAKHFARDHRGAIPPNFTCSDSIPQRAALRDAALLVTHGGANSILEAIAHAVPILAIPLCSDQFRNAALVERLGIGTTLDARDVSPSTVQAAISRALETRDRESLTLRKQQLIAATSHDALHAIAP